MNRWTVAAPFAGQFRLHISHGGPPIWCMFDYSVSPAPINGGVEITIIDNPDATTTAWFPWIRKGMLRGLETSRQHGRELVGVRVLIQKVYAHPVDTTERACERYGYSFVTSTLSDRAVAITEPATT